LNKTGLSTDPWGTPLVTGLQLDSAQIVQFLGGLINTSSNGNTPAGILLWPRVGSQA